MKSLTTQLKEALKMNGYHDWGNTFRKVDSYKEKSFKFLGHGWVEVYERQYPATEGWSQFNTHVGHALENHVGF